MLIGACAKLLDCVLIGACAVIRSNMVSVRLLSTLDCVTRSQVQLMTVQCFIAECISFVPNVLIRLK